MTKCKLTIFEGPDGGGKTTGARDYADRTGAKYVHLGPLKSVPAGQLARFYLEAILPALQGYQDVVLDRCWLSEVPYGMAFRNGQVRLTRADERMLQRACLSLDPVVVLCLPPVANCVETFEVRRALGDELLDTTEQLGAVYATYAALDTGLPTIQFDFTTTDFSEVVEALGQRLGGHQVDRLYGSAAPRVILVGEALAAPKSTDLLYQVPFVSFSNEGCSRWLTNRLEEVGLAEESIAWCNVAVGEAPDWDLMVSRHAGAKVVALGHVASRALDQADVEHHTVPHPAFWKRFHGKFPYPLQDTLKKALGLASLNRTYDE